MDPKRPAPTRPAPSVRPAPAGRPAAAGRVVLVHGFTQTSACWAPIDEALTADHEVLPVDAPGHGTASSQELDLPAGAGAILARGGPGPYGGYSMGARFCLHAALARPDLVQCLVLISGTAGLDDPAERAARRDADETLADHVVAVGIPAFLDEWLALPLFAGVPPERAHRAARETNTAAGLASSLRLAGTGTQVPLWDRLPELAMPVLVVVGANDTKFTTLGRRMVEAIGPNAELAVIEGAGHTVHLEQPDLFLAALLPWLENTPNW